MVSAQKDAKIPLSLRFRAILDLYIVEASYRLARFSYTALTTRRLVDLAQLPDSERGLSGTT